MPDPDQYDEAEGGAIVEIEPELADRLRDAQQAFDEVSEYLDDLKTQIKERFAAHDRVTAQVNGETVLTCNTHTSARFNSLKFRNEWPDLYAQFCSTSRVRRVVIKRWPS